MDRDARTNGLARPVEHCQDTRVARWNRWRIFLDMDDMVRGEIDGDGCSANDSHLSPPFPLRPANVVCGGGDRGDPVRVGGLRVELDQAAAGDAQRARNYGDGPQVR